MPVYMGIFDKPNVLAKDFRGGVKAKGYQGWIALKSAQIGINRTTNTTGRGSMSNQDIVITKDQDSVSTALFTESLKGHGKLIVIVFVKEDGTTYLKAVLQDTLITSYSISGHGGDGGDSRPTESLSLNFAKMTFEISAKSPDTTPGSMYQLSQQPTWDFP